MAEAAIGQARTLTRRLCARLGPLPTGPLRPRARKVTVKNTATLPWPGAER